MDGRYCRSYASGHQPCFCPDAEYNVLSTRSNLLTKAQINKKLHWPSKELTSLAEKMASNGIKISEDAFKV